MGQKAAPAEGPLAKRGATPPDPEPLHAQKQSTGTWEVFGPHRRCAGPQMNPDFDGLEPQTIVSIRSGSRNRRYSGVQPDGTLCRIRCAERNH